MEALKSSLSGDDAVAGLRSFIAVHKDKFKFEETEAVRRSLAGALLKFLAGPNRDVDGQCLSLEALRILCRESSGLEPLSSVEGLDQLLKLARIIVTEPGGQQVGSNGLPSGDMDWRTALEATKCLCNLTYHIHEAVSRMVNELNVVQPLVRQVGSIWAPEDALFYRARLLFLIAAVHRPAVTTIRDGDGLAWLVSRLLNCLHLKTENSRVNWEQNSTLSSADQRLAADLMKILFSVTMLEVSWTDAERIALEQFYNVVRLLLVCPQRLEGEEAEGLQMQLVFVLVNLPESCGSSITPKLEHGESTDGLVVFEGSDVTAARCLLDILEQQLREDPPKTDKQVGLLSALARCARCSRVARRYWCKTLLPTLMEVTQRPEQGDSLKARLVRLMTSPNSTVSRTVTDFLFVLCKENPSRFVKHTGYGNAAGLLMQRGLLGNWQTVAATDYSSDSDDGLGPEQDPVTGGPPRPPTLDDMTEEEKEVEAEKLVKLFDQLEKTGVIKVLTQQKAAGDRDSDVD